MEDMNETPAELRPIENKQSSFCGKLRFVINNVTVEPILTGFLFSSIISQFGMANLNLDKACRVNLKIDREVCDALVSRIDSENYTKYEKEVQKLISSINIWKNIITHMFPAVIILFLGAWSDRTGKRKICILLPILGEFLTCISNLVNVYFFYEIPVQLTVLSEAIFSTILGGWSTLYLGVYSYISDITDEKSRTFRVGVVSVGLTLAVPSGIGIGGYMLQAVGYYGVFSTSLVIFALLIAYGCTILKDSNEWLKHKGFPVVEREKSSVSFFNLKKALQTTSVAYRKRSSGRRFKVIFTLIAVFLLKAPSLEQEVLYLFLRNQLNWGLEDYATYVVFYVLLHVSGSLIIISIFSKKLQVQDYLLCFLAICSKIAAGIYTVFVTTTLQMFMVPVIDTMFSTITALLRSILSKLVDKQEIAKVNSLFSLTEMVAALLFSPLYSWLYMKTLYVLPGAVFLAGSVIILPAAFIQGSFYIQYVLGRRKQKRKNIDYAKKNEDELNETNHD